MEWKNRWSRHQKESDFPGFVEAIIFYFIIHILLKYFILLFNYKVLQTLPNELHSTIFSIVFATIRSVIIEKSSNKMFIKISKKIHFIAFYWYFNRHRSEVTITSYWNFADHLHLSFFCHRFLRVKIDERCQHQVTAVIVIEFKQQF